MVPLVIIVGYMLKLPSGVRVKEALMVIVGDMLAEQQFQMISRQRDDAPPDFPADSSDEPLDTDLWGYLHVGNHSL